MSRKILFVDNSPTLNRILSTMILANINDVEISSSESFAAAEELLAKQDFHVVLFSWELAPQGWPDFFAKLGRQRGGHKPAFIMLTSMDDEDTIRAARAVGIANFLTIPCVAPELVDIVNHACNPVSLRRDKRYSIPGTTVKLEQGGHTVMAEVINISKGGLLCEFDCQEGFNCLLPALSTVKFTIGAEAPAAVGIMGMVSLVKVVKNNDDLSPARVRAAYVFKSPSTISLEVLERVFNLADDQEQLLDAG